ncbi:MAG: hypothetical protein WA051_00735 [Minisyncoccia bacterium]
MERNKLIVLEGGDAAGKGTQTPLVVSSIKALGKSCGTLSFPMYDRPIGRLVREFLMGEHGDFRNADPILSAMPFILDRIAAREQIWSTLGANDFTISNRYVESNLGFNAAKVPTEEQDILVRRLIELEYQEINLIPRPDRVIYLAVSPETSMKLLEKRGDKKDQYEQDIEFQARVETAYRRIAVSDPMRWRVVNCDPNGVMRTPQSIHEEVMMHVHELLSR